MASAIRTKRAVSLRGETYDRMRVAARDRGTTVVALLEEAIGYLPRPSWAGEDREVIEVPAQLYAAAGKVVRRTVRPIADVLEGAILAALADAERYPARIRPARRRPMVDHASRRRGAA